GIPGVIELLSGDQLFRAHYFAELAAHPHFGSGRLLSPDIAVSAADPEVDFADRHCPTVRAKKPAADQIRFGERIEHQFARGIEISLDFNLQIGGCRNFEAVGVKQHSGLLSWESICEKLSGVLPFWVLALRAKHPGGQRTLPKTHDTVRARRWPRQALWPRAGLAAVERRDLS